MDLRSYFAIQLKNFPLLKKRIALRLHSDALYCPSFLVPNWRTYTHTHTHLQNTSCVSITLVRNERKRRGCLCGQDGETRQRHKLKWSECDLLWQDGGRDLKGQGPMQAEVHTTTEWTKLAGEGGPRMKRNGWPRPRDTHNMWSGHCVLSTWTSMHWCPWFCTFSHMTMVPLIT